MTVDNSCDLFTAVNHLYGKDIEEYYPLEEEGIKFEEVQRSDFPIIGSFFLTKIILGCVYLITVVWFHSQVMFMRVIIIIIKQESGSWSGQDQNIYLTTEVGIFWKGKLFCLAVMSLKVKA